MNALAATRHALNQTATILEHPAKFEMPYERALYSNIAADYREQAALLENVTDDAQTEYFDTLRPHIAQMLLDDVRLWLVARELDTYSKDNPKT